jgi:hypothetical protein
LNKKEQKIVLSTFKTRSKSGQKIASMTGLPRHQVMAFLENQGLTRYSEGSYA